MLPGKNTDTGTFMPSKHQPSAEATLSMPASQQALELIRRPHSPQKLHAADPRDSSESAQIEAQ